MEIQISEELKQRILNGEFAEVLGQGVGVEGQDFDFVVPLNLRIELIPTGSDQWVFLSLKGVDPKDEEVELLDIGTHRLQIQGGTLTIQGMPPWPVHLDKTEYK